MTVNEEDELLMFIKPIPLDEYEEGGFKWDMSVITWHDGSVVELGLGFQDLESAQKQMKDMTYKTAQETWLFHNQARTNKNLEL